MDDFKRSLVEEIGFGGLNRLPCISRINLKFSKWLMSRVDGPGRAIKLDDRRRIRFWTKDIAKVFGIPCGPREIHGPDSNCSETTVAFIRSALGMPEKGSLILRAAENIVTRPLNESESSNLEKDCFKMAFVIFAMGHLLAPCTKHDSTSIDYWAAIANVDRIKDFNWCQYIMHELLSASAHVQSDIENNKENTHLHGCHLFLQVGSFPLLFIRT
jgi:hypothetical protein